MDLRCSSFGAGFEAVARLVHLQSDGNWWTKSRFSIRSDGNRLLTDVPSRRQLEVISRRRFLQTFPGFLVGAGGVLHSQSQLLGGVGRRNCQGCRYQVFSGNRVKGDRLRFVPYELEPRLALAEIEVDLGDRANARSQLEALRKQATDRGFGLIALKAAADLKGLRPRN